MESRALTTPASGQISPHAAASGEHTAAPMTRVEMERALTEWARDALGDENRITAKEQMLACFDTQAQGDSRSPLVLDLRNLGLKSVPDCIGELTRLQILNLENNQLTSLPEKIGKLTGLKYLYLKGNQLTNLPENIGTLTGLETLCLEGNQLTLLPENIGRLTGLEYLYLKGNQLTTLPESIGGLPRLMRLDLANNPLNNLPRRIVELPRSCRVDLGTTTLPPAVMDAVNRGIEERQATHPNTGPQIIHSMPPGPGFVERPLLDEIAAWYTEAQAGEADRAAWAQAIHEAGIEPPSQQALSSLLGRLRLTAHYRLAPADLQQRVHDLLDYLRSAPPALEACAAQAVEGTETCNDRIALAFLLMEEARLRHTAEQAVGQAGAPEKLRAIARSLYKSDVLREVANCRVAAARGFVDATEFILKYWVRLSKELDLPCKLDDMIFHRCATQVSEADIDHAREEVRQAERDPARFDGYLARWPPWRALLEHHLPEEYRAAQRTIDDFKERCTEELGKQLEELAEISHTQGELSADHLDLQIKINTTWQTKIAQYQTETLTKLAQKLPVGREAEIHAWLARHCPTALLQHARSEPS